ncbi:protein-S-isoprenylcysteine O-methyltransferase [Microlunatus aurantiacus]|uniref:Protein-S-isoprenylcysteine O-methyltransferase n=2 Tax=Microlunatus aurantiacus TaxID=446786 RepID=A0ABP7EEN7_9ACTN
MIMDQDMFKAVYLAGFILIFAIRLPYWWMARGVPVVTDRKKGSEKVLLATLSVGVGVLPLVYVFAPLLRVADYRLPTWMGWMGAVVFTFGLWILWRAHAGLGRYWSDSLQLREGQQLVTSGIYRRIRHPMYAFGWLLAIAQVLLLWNWIAGWSGVVAFALLYFLRVPREEQMMIDQFGEHYRAY